MRTSFGGGAPQAASGAREAETEAETDLSTALLIPLPCAPIPSSFPFLLLPSSSEISRLSLPSSILFLFLPSPIAMANAPGLVSPPARFLRARNLAPSGLFRPRLFLLARNATMAPLRCCAASVDGGVEDHVLGAAAASSNRRLPRYVFSFPFSSFCRRNF